MPKLPSILRRFYKEERGQIAMIFAGAIIPVGVLLGTAHDFGRCFNTREEMQYALDAAVFAAGREFDATASMAKAETIGRAHFEATLPSDVKGHVTSFKGDAQGNITMKASSDVEMTFLKLAGTNAVDVSVESRSLTEDEGGMNLELAIVMDVTGSMDENNKMEAARQAALQLVNILLPEGYSGARSVRVSLVPFSQMVNLGTFGSSAMNTPNQYRTCKTKKSPPYQDQCKTWNSYKNGTPTAAEAAAIPAPQYKYVKGCTVERMGTASGGSDAAAYGDTPPGPGAYFHSYGTSSSSATACTPLYPIIPLTSDRDLLIPAIESLDTGGSTAGHIGTAWGWYTISQNWATYWQDNAGADRTPANPDPKLMKAIIIMTDGMYNTHYDTDWSTISEDSRSEPTPNAANGYSRRQAQKICTNMKTQGIEVFAVGVELPGSPSDASNPETARGTLAHCVTSPNHLFERHFYDVIDSWNVGDGLTAAFSDIGNKIATATGTGNSRIRLTR